MPPELRALVEGQGLPPGRAVDLGCGTGTCVLYLAQRGFQVVGIDIASRAIAKARRKLQRAAAQAQLDVGDVTRLAEPDGPPVPAPLDFALDQGCFHALPEKRHAAYARGLGAVLRPGATFLLYAFQPRGRGGPPIGPRGITPAEVESIFGQAFRVLTVERGSYMCEPFWPRPTGVPLWYRLERR